MALFKDTDFPVAGTVAPPICEDKLTELERARQVLRTRIDVYKSHIIETTRRMNDLVDINRLPPEIFSEILFHTTLATRRSYPSRKEWIKITHVCHLWREVALTTPRLWADITADKLDWTREMLYRSKKAPLKIMYPWNSGFSRDRQEISTLVFREIQRVESLKIYNDDYTDYIRPPNMMPIAPLLSSLYINGDVNHHRESKGETLSGILETIAMPKLAHLELSRTRRHWSTPLLQPTLTSLIFHRSGASSAVATPEQPPSLRSDFACVLKVLGDMPLLENLTLNNSLPPLHDTALPQLDHYTTLPVLRRLNVIAAPDSCAFLLQHLIIPPSTSVAISCMVLPNDNLLNVTSAFASKLRESSTSSTLPPLHTLFYDTYSFRIWRDTFELDTFCDQFRHGRDIPLPQFRFHVYYGSNSVQLQPLSSTLSSLPLDEVQSLILGPPGAPRDGGVHGWLEVFACMPNVRELAVQNWFENIPEALKMDLPLPVDQQRDRKNKRKDAGVPFPNLKVLRLADVSFRDNMNQRGEENSIIQRTKSMLQTRKKCRRGIERLIIQRALNFDTEDKDDLHCLVEELEWDEREELRAE